MGTAGKAHENARAHENNACAHERGLVSVATHERVGDAVLGGSQAWHCSAMRRSNCASTAATAS